MVDDTNDPGNTNTLDDVSTKTTNIGNNLASVYSQMAEINRHLGDVNGIVADMDKQMNTVKAKMAQSGEQIGTGIKDSTSKGAKGAITAVSSIFSDITSKISESIGKVIKSGEALKTILSAGIGFASAFGAKEVLKTFNDQTGGLLDLQQSILSVNKSATQLGASFGLSFGEGIKSASLFRNRYVESMTVFKATKEDLEKLRGGFKDALNVQDQIGAISGLGSVLTKTTATLSATNVALSIASATGMDHGEVAKEMSQMYTQLGNTLDEAALSFGKIMHVTEKSGLGFETVSKGILSATDSLKWWGGTVASVSPMFEAFSRNLEKGQKGLAPEMLQAYTRGLGQMSLAQKGLMGMQMPGMRGGGAIGAGLKMEAALEDKTGAGMKEISSSLIQTMKQFGGGQVLTRKEALENPALERNFLVQRGLLQQMLHVDEATANKMMGSFKDMDENGLDSVDGAEDLGKLLDTGQKTQETLTGELIKAETNYHAEALAGGEKLLGAIKQLADVSGVSGITRRLGKELADVSKTGTLKPEDLPGVIKRILTGDAGDRRPQGRARQDVEKVSQRRIERLDTKRRVAIARAVGEDPKKVIKDEMSRAADIAKESGKSAKEIIESMRRTGLNAVKEFASRAPRGQGQMRRELSTSVAQTIQEERQTLKPAKKKTKKEIVAEESERQRQKEQEELDKKIGRDAFMRGRVGVATKDSKPESTTEQLPKAPPLAPLPEIPGKPKALEGSTRAMVNQALSFNNIPADTVKRENRLEMGTELTARRNMDIPIVPTAPVRDGIAATAAAQHGREEPKKRQESAKPEKQKVDIEVDVKAKQNGTELIINLEPIVKRIIRQQHVDAD